MRAAMIASLMLVGCGTITTPSTPTVATNSLAGTAWVRVDDLDANPHGATLEFGDDRASGHTGCNRWFASVTHDGEEIRFGQMGMTRMACQAEVQRATERNFIAAIDAARYARHDGDALVLLDAQQHQIARFESTAAER